MKSLISGCKLNISISCKLISRKAPKIWMGGWLISGLGTSYIGMRVIFGWGGGRVISGLGTSYIGMRVIFGWGGGRVISGLGTSIGMSQGNIWMGWWVIIWTGDFNRDEGNIWMGWGG